MPRPTNNERPAALCHVQQCSLCGQDRDNSSGDQIKHRDTGFVSGGMTDQFFERPILNSPYEYPRRHWELDEAGQPTQKIIETRRWARFITPIPKPKKRKAS